MCRLSASNPGQRPALSPAEKISSVLQNQYAKTVIAGIGNLLRNDDGAGPWIASQIKKKSNIVVYIPETGIERYITAINREQPDLIIFIDCVDFGKHPGFWDVVPAADIQDSTCHSHNISLHMLTRFFFTTIWVIGVQPANIEVGEMISAPVRAASYEIVSLFNGS